jgi:hypothetical protein
MTTLEEIMQIEGIVVRKIPKQTTSCYGMREKDFTRELQENETIIYTESGRPLMQTIKHNNMAGYIVTTQMNQDSTVRFNKQRDGIGQTIEAAYQDYLNKN